MKERGKARDCYREKFHGREGLSTTLPVQRGAGQNVPHWAKMVRNLYLPLSVSGYRWSQGDHGAPGGSSLSAEKWTLSLTMGGSLLTAFPVFG